MNSKLVFYFLLLITNSSYASETTPIKTGDDKTNAILKTPIFIWKTVTNNEDQSVANDTIEGKCSYTKGSCSGAKVSLIYKGNVITTHIIKPDGLFSFSGLKDKKYKVEIELTNSKVKKIVDTRTGNRINFVLEDKGLKVSGT